MKKYLFFLIVVLAVFVAWIYWERLKCWRLIQQSNELNLADGPVWGINQQGKCVDIGTWDTKEQY